MSNECVYTNHKDEQNPKKRKEKKSEKQQQQNERSDPVIQRGVIQLGDSE